MVELRQRTRPKKRPRDLVQSPQHDACKEAERGRRRPRREYLNGHWPPGFWDRLSKVHLTRGALREFERRITRQRPPAPTSRPVPSTEKRHLQLKRFSRHGGPSLMHLRGFADFHDRTHYMSSQNAGRKRSTTSGGSGKGRSSTTSRSRGSYDPNFRQNLIDLGIYPKGDRPPGSQSTDKPRNLDEIRRALLEPRASLSPSRFNESAFEEFERANDQAKGETRVMAEAFSIIEGSTSHQYHSDGPDHPFNNLEPLGASLPTAKPDLYDGVVPAQIDPAVRREIGKYIMPCSDGSRPAAPNFYVEGKSAAANPTVALLQACHDGAVGARAMYHLQNYGLAEPEYDGNSRGYSSTYHPGTASLKLYAHHITPPQALGGRPEYHMTQLRGYDMTDSAQRCREGMAAYRNLRDQAWSNRTQLVEIANHRARQNPIQGPATTKTRNVTSNSVIFGDKSDTSEDDGVAAEAPNKRHRHARPATQPSAGHTHLSRVDGQNNRPNANTAPPRNRSGKMLPPDRASTKRQVRPS